MITVLSLALTFDKINNISDLNYIFENHLRSTGDVRTSGKVASVLISRGKGTFSFKYQFYFEHSLDNYLLDVNVPFDKWALSEIDHSNQKLDCSFFVGTSKAKTILDFVKYFIESIDGRIAVKKSEYECFSYDKKEQEVYLTLRKRLINEILLRIENEPVQRIKNGYTLILAGIFGEDKYIQDNIIETFKTTGLYHLLVVSGYQISLLLNLTTLVSNALLRRRISLLKYLPKKFFSLICCIPLLLLLLSLNNSSLPIWRAVVTFLVMAFLTFFNYRIHPARLIIITMIVMNLIWPMSVLSPGSQLTFAALSGVFFGSGLANNFHRQGSKSYKFVNFLYPNLFAILFVLPFQVLWFGTFGLKSILYNVTFAYPFSWVVVLFSIIGLPTMFLIPSIMRFQSYLIGLIVEIISW